MQDHACHDAICAHWYALRSEETDQAALDEESEADKCMMRTNKMKGYSLYRGAQPCGQLPGPLPRGALYIESKRGRLLFEGG